MATPVLRFKNNDGSSFPDWEQSTLGKKFTFITTKNKDNLITNVITNSAEFGLIPQRDYFKKDIANKDNTSKYKVINNGDFVYNPRKSTCAPFGPFNLYKQNEPGIISPLYTCLRPLNKVWTQYLSYYFQSSKWHPYVATHGAKGARQDRVSMTKPVMQGIPVSMPTSIDEQNKITDLLSTVDDVITKQKAEIDAWELRKKGVAQRLFSQEVRFKADDGSDFPAWGSKTLGELGSFQKGAPLSKADISDQGTPLILYGELYTTYSEVTYTVARKTEKSSDPKFLSQSGDVLIPTSGETAVDISRATCVMQDGVILAGDLLIYRPTEGLDGRILSYIVNYQVKAAISRVAQGGQVVHIKESDISKIKAMFPVDPTEQHKIADCLDAFDDVIAKAKAELELWRELKRGLLQQLFV